ncbi:MAG: hypothetical protein IAF58_07760 [Leptolyngbya sp.]|nr:hypothetical protein [Candidatus Melainabacteria bacterium]
MNFVQIIATLRKFGNYLAGLFPPLVWIADLLAKPFLYVANLPVLKPFREKLAANSFFKSFWKIFERFYWRTYSKDRLDLTEAPPETVSLLKPLFQLCAVMCVLIPFTQYNLLPVNIESFSGFNGTAPAWSVALWLLVLPCAWAALLTGAARSNRIIFAVFAVGAAYFLTTCVVLLPRSFFNAAMPIAILVSLVFCEYRQKANTATDAARGFLNASIVGIAAGIPLMILTPIRPYLATVINLPGPAISIGGGALLGIILGLLCLSYARSTALAQKPDTNIQNAGMVVNAWAVTILLTVFLLAGASRGSLAQSGGMLISSLSLTNGYLWPLWYFIGVGILHKLMGSSKIVASSIGSMLPPVFLNPLILLTLIASLFAAYSERVCFYLSSATDKTLIATLPFFYQIYAATKPYIWSNPLNTMTVHWLSWVLLFDALVVLVLVIQRRLNAEVLTRLLFLTTLAALLTAEYVFQMSSFARPLSHSTTALFLFAIWLLWLMHTVGWDLSSRSSPAWPAAGRLAIYSGIATIALLDIHARSACKDFKLMNELFLTMFRGVIDVGLPYYFLVWTARRIEQLPVKVSSLLGLFSLGALAAFCFNALEKLAGAGWSIPGLMLVANKQLELMRSTGNANIDLVIPDSWYALRAVLYVSLLSLIYVCCSKKIRANSSRSVAVLFVLVAFASGIASFSKTLVELPVPPEVRAYIAPCVQELTFNCALFQSYLVYWIPALILGVSQLYGSNKLRNFLFAVPAAALTHFLISWSYAEYETYLRACNTLYMYMSILGGFFILVVALCLPQITECESEALQQGERKEKTALLSPKTLVSLLILAEMILIPLTVLQSNLKFASREIPSLARSVSIPEIWQQQADAAGMPQPQSSTFVRKGLGAGMSMLQIGSLPSEPEGVKALLKKLLAAATSSGVYQNLSVVSIESWGRYRTDAICCQFSYEIPKSQPVITMSGLTVLVPSGAKTEFYTLYTSPSEIGKEQWEMAAIIQRLEKR